MRTDRPALVIDTSCLWPGLRLGVGVSGGADSVALLRALHARSGELGLVLTVAHLHHGLRGAEADGDLEFVRELAARLGLEFVSAQVDTEAEAKQAGETIEEAARRLRYGWFRELMTKAGSGCVDAVATAHTRDDQAETVLAKFLRGAWTEGLAGIHPVVEFAEGRIVRPLLGTARAQVEACLRRLGQEWREDSTNRKVTFTRNRIRHELLPQLEGWNPRLREHLAQMAELARDEETWWSAATERAAAEILLRGRPVRGGGRAATEGLALDLNGLAALPVAMQRRVLRWASKRLDASLDFEATESLRDLALTGRAGQKCELAGGLRAERSHRELRLTIQATGTADGAGLETAQSIEVPGEIVSPGFGVRLRVELDGEAGGMPRTATLRNWKPGDRVKLRYSGTARKVKEVLERMKISGSDRASWPVLELDEQIVWMRGAALETEPGIRVTVRPLDEAQLAPDKGSSG